MHFEQYYNKIENVLKNHHVSVPQEKMHMHKMFHDLSSSRSNVR